VDGELARFISHGERFQDLYAHRLAEDALPDLSIPTRRTVAEVRVHVARVVADQGAMAIVHPLFCFFRGFFVALAITWNLGDVDDVAIPDWFLVPVGVFCHRLQDFVYVQVSLVDCPDPLYASWREDVSASSGENIEPLFLSGMGVQSLHGTVDPRLSFLATGAQRYLV